MTEIKSGRKCADVKLYIAILAHDSKNFCVMSGSLIDSVTAMIAAGIPHTPAINWLMQDGNTPFARNRALANFMKTDCTDLIFIDSDVSWDIASFMRLICHPVDVVGATYRKKIQNQETGDLITQYAIELLYDEDGDSAGSNYENGLLEVKRLPAGFLRITRAAAQRMINECTDAPEYEIDDHGKPLTLNRFFSFDYVDGVEISEDYRFCDRWRAIGGKVWCDPEMKVDHHGIAVFKGHFGQFMRDIIAKHKAKIESVPMAEAAE